MSEDSGGPVSGRVRSNRRARVLIAGSTGLVGTVVTDLLAADARLDVVALVRSNKPRERVETRVFDYENDESYVELARDAFDVLVLCLGTTRKKAGSDEAFRRVDLDYPSKLLGAVGGGVSAIGLVSSVGAESGRGLYLGTKLELERRVMATGARYVIVRPSFLVGAREEFRLGERVGLATVAPLLKGLGAIASGMKKYAPIRAEEVARALVSTLVPEGIDPRAARGSSSVVLEGKALFDAAR